MRTWPRDGNVPPESTDSARGPGRDLLVNAAMAALAAGFALLSEQNALYDNHHHPVALRVTDILLGVVCLAGTWLWRRRWPVGFAVFAIAAGIVSTVGGGVGLVGVFTVAVHRRWQSAVAVSVLAAASVVPSLLIYPVPHDARAETIGILMTFAVTGWGMFVRARRLLLASLRTQLTHAEHAAASRAETARRTERERIAREMHDVLAHRLSLLALHAGALEFRTDATAEEVARAAGVIRTNAHDAIGDLRSVITVLRDHDPDAELDRRQPTLADLPALIDESRQTGLAVSLRRTGDVAEHADELDPATGRTVYRIVQEALTNVRKHAAYSRASIALDARRGDRIEVSIRNQITRPDDDTDRTSPMPGSGTGLIGLSERAALAGGHLDYGPTDDGLSFLLHARLPWPGSRGTNEAARRDQHPEPDAEHEAPPTPGDSQRARL